MTSNIGYDNSKIGFTKERSKLSKEMKDFFSIEFLNRIDKIYYFHSFCGKDIKKIVTFKLNLLKKFFKDKIEFNYSTEVVEEIIKESNYQEFGARKIDKIINEEVSSKITSNLIKGIPKLELNSLKTT